MEQQVSESQQNSDTHPYMMLMCSKKFIATHNITKTRHRNTGTLVEGPPSWIVIFVLFLYMHIIVRQLRRICNIPESRGVSAPLPYIAGYATVTICNACTYVLNPHVTIGADF